MLYEYLTYKQFRQWCDTHSDVQWEPEQAQLCVNICSELDKTFFLFRERKWKQQYEESIRNIVNKIEVEIERKKSAMIETYNDICDKSVYNQNQFRSIDNDRFHMDVPFVIKKDALNIGKKLDGKTNAWESTNLCDYMTIPYDKCTLKECCYYDEFDNKFVYHLWLTYNNGKGIDCILVIEVDKFEELNQQRIDSYIAELYRNAFDHVDVECIESKIKEAEIERNFQQATINFLNATLIGAPL